jgi:hypothetical protein
VTQFTAAGVFEALLKLYWRDSEKGSSIWGDKSPTYTRHVAKIARTFPEARFVHIVRDVRDVAASSWRAWGSNPYRTSQRWADAVLLPSSDARGADIALMELRYEDLLTNPSMEIAKICEFIGITYSDEMLAFKKSPENLGDTKGARGVVAGNVNKAAEVFSREQIRNVEAIGQDALVAFNYSVDGVRDRKRLSTSQLWWYRLGDGLRHLAREMKTRGIRRGASFVWQFFKQNIKTGS